MLTRLARPSSVHALLSAIHLRVARRKSLIRENGKRWQVPVASTGIGKVVTGITLTIEGIGLNKCNRGMASHPDILNFIASVVGNS